jgi:hypothetical protein
MKTQLKWRLTKLPTPSELVELVNAKLVSQDEAKEILFTTETKEDLDANALKKEIEFLRKVVEDLSKSRSETVRVVEKHINHYKDWTWYQPYNTWCSGTMYLSGSGSTTLGNLSNGVTLTTTGGNYLNTNVSTTVSNSAPSFNTIQTF